MENKDTLADSLEARILASEANETEGDKGPDGPEHSEHPEQHKPSNQSTWNKVIGVGIALVVLLIGTYIYSRNVGISTKMVDYMGTAVTVSSVTDSIEVMPSRLSVNTGKYRVEIEVDFSDCEIIEFNCTDTFTHVSYYDTETMINTSINLHSPGLTSETEPSRDEIKVATEASDDDNILKTVSTLNLKGIAIIEVIQVKEADNENELYTTKLLETISECALYSPVKQTENKTYLTIDGLGTYNMMNIELDYVQGSKSGLEILPSNIDDRYSIKGLADGNWEIVDNLSWNNVYDIGDSLSDFGLQTTKGFYYFDFKSDEATRVRANLISTLGIQPDDEENSVVFEVKQR